MFSSKKDLFLNKDNELIFEQICEKLKKHPFETPWKININAPKDENSDFYLMEVVDIGMDISHISEAKIPFECSPCTADFSFQGIPLPRMSKSYEVPQLCDILKSSLSNEVSLVLFLSAVLKMEKPLSLSVAAALINHIAYPLVFESKMNNTRNVLASILNFSEIYPKAVIDEIVIPCLRRDNLENLHFETLMKMTGCNLPHESVSYCIKSILELALPLDNTFSILKNVIERKIHLEKKLHDSLAWKLEAWSTNHTKHVKFTKLIICILTIYGSELKDQFATYHNIIERNGTIMKKAAENVLKKLKN